MKLKRHPMVAAGPAPTAGAASRSHHIVPRVVKLLSVTAVAATTCAMWALPASAATKHASTTTVSVAKSAFVGASVKLSATVKSSGTPTGVVTFWLGTRKLCHGTLSKGATSCSARFYSINTKTITGKYSGDGSHAASSGTAKLKVVRSGTVTKITNANPSNVDSGAAFTFHVQVVVAAGTPPATGFVTVAPTDPAGLSAAFRCTATLAGGKGSCTIHPPGFGIIHYQASYSGSPVHISSKTAAGVFALAVQNTTTTTVAPATAAPGDVTLVATVVNQAASDIAPPDGNGTVAFYVDGAVVCPAQPLADASAGADNLATCDDTLAAGTYTVDAVYSGDDTNVTSTGTVTLVVS